MRSGRRRSSFNPGTVRKDIFRPQIATSEVIATGNRAMQILDKRSVWLKPALAVAVVASLSSLEQTCSRTTP